MKEIIRKKGRKIWSLHVEEDEAVSPVIATILMVAVTVILAATVYFLVSYYSPNIISTPLSGSLSVYSSTSNSTTLLLTLATTGYLKNPSNFQMQIINTSSTSTGVGWTILNATITNPDGTALYMNTFTSYSNVWTSNGAVPIKGATSIQSGAYITIIFHSSGSPVVMSDLKVSISYKGDSGTVYTQLT